MQTKQAETPLAAQLLAALLGLNLMGSDHQHVAEQEAEAEAMTQRARELEARKMDQTISALSPKMASAGATVGTLVKIAAAVTVANGDQEKLAYLLEQQGMSKEAIGAILGGLARAGGAVLKSIGGAASAAGRLKLPTTGTQRLMAAGGQAVPKAPGMFAGNTARMLHAGGEATPALSAASQGPGTLQRAGSWIQGKGQALAQQGQQVAQAAPSAVRPAAGGGSLLSGMTKAKMIGGGALLGAGYLGMKGLQAGRDYMMQPTGAQHAPGPKHNINEFGYPSS